jgi:hypothetical protein
MSLNPEDSRRRGRSKSPGRRDERDRSRGPANDIRERSRTRVIERAPSPPTARYEDDRDSRRKYEYEEETARSSRKREEPRYAPEDHRASSPPRPSYAIPGAFEEREEPKVKYAGGREKEYYQEKKYSKLEESSGDEEPVRSKYSSRYEHEPEPEPARSKYSKQAYESDESPERPKYSKKAYELEESPERPKYAKKAYESDESPERPQYGKKTYEPDPRDRYEEEKRRFEEEKKRERYEEKDRGFSANFSGGINIGRGKEYRPPSPGYPTSPPYGHESPPYPVAPAGYGAPAIANHAYAEPKKWEYAQPDDKISYGGRKENYTARPSSYERPSYGDPRSSQTKVVASYGPSPHSSQTQVYEASPRSSQTQVYGSAQYGAPPSASQKKVVTVDPGQRRISGVDNLAPRMHSLSVSTGHQAVGVSVSMAPGSPLLEAYHGTYQSISPMPSPLMIAAHAHSSNTDVQIMDIGPISPGKTRHARFNDPVSDASTLAKALKGTKTPDIDDLIEILPPLTHEQIMELRVQYKKMVKTGSEKKGVNIAKHIKLRLKEQDPSLMKACYSVALGRWESEAYWANFWYQGEKSRRELLIESLMGRTNAEIRAIKDGFSDKKYSDSLTKCMKMELKEDKFKKGVLLVLEERRMEEGRLDRALVEQDVTALYKAVRAEKGGESAMIGIIVLRSDSHLREVLRLYEVTYRQNFAREMLKKSGNLVVSKSLYLQFLVRASWRVNEEDIGNQHFSWPRSCIFQLTRIFPDAFMGDTTLGLCLQWQGELLAHILNGVINRPVRDALLLNHALTLTKSDGLRTELLISRLVRYHWDSAHMEAIKREYRNRYGKELQQAVRDGSKGAWGEFCEELCVRRMPDDVRRVERVSR